MDNRSVKARFRALLRQSATRQFLALGASIFLGEALVMLLLAHSTASRLWAFVVLDASLLVVVLFPILYLEVLRPLTAEMAGREHAERAQRAFETELRAILDSTADGILAVDDEGKILHTNQRFLELWRIPQALLADGDNQVLLDFVLDQLEAPDLFIAKVRSLYGSVAEDMDTLRFKDGRTFERFSVPVRMEGTRIGRVWSFRDITERQRAGEHLSEQERQYRALFEAHPEAMWVYDRETLRFLAVNDAAVSRYGYSRREFQAMTIADIRPTEDVPAFQRFVDALTDKLTVSGDWRHRVRDGRILHVEIGSHPLLFRGRPARLVVARDVTARREAERAVRSADALRKIAASAARLGGWAVEVENQHLLVSEETRRLLDAPPGTGLTVADAIAAYGAEESRAAMVGLYQRCRTHGVPFDAEVQMIARTGRRFWGRVVGEAERDASGRIVRIHGALQDIDERKRAEQEKEALEHQLQQSQRLESVGLLAGGVAHDFNNMLGVILGSAEMALEQVSAAHPLYVDLHEIRKAAQRSADLTRKLLAFARQQPVEPRELDLNEAVPGMVTMLQRLIGADIQLDWVPGNGLWPILMDPSQVDQILTNLVVNARHAIDGVGVVSIATANQVIDDAFCATRVDAAPGDYVRLTVHDTGCGMDAATLARIFEPFFTTKDIGEGTGLGLASVYGAVRQNGGFISVSSALNLGTTFEICLPRMAGREVPARHSGAVALAGRGDETILIVEDEPAMLRLTRRVLEAWGYDVLSAANPVEALRRASEHPHRIHLLLTDVVMPAMSGLDLATALRKIRPDVKLLFMSGHTADVIAHRGILMQGVPFIQKPFAPGALAAKVREALDRE